MYRRFATFSLLAGTLALLTGATAFADPNALTAEEKEAGFRPLFNGEDLTGWREVQGTPGTFTVEDGVLVAKRKRFLFTRGAYWLSTQEKYGDFVLRLEVLLSPGGNSGVFIRVPSYAGRSSVEGMEIQLLDDGSKTGKPTSNDTGAIYRVVAPKSYEMRPAGEWNEVEIACKGDRIQVAVNGTPITDANMSEHSELANRPREGYIGVSCHTFVTKFRNIRLRSLDDETETADAR